MQIKLNHVSLTVRNREASAAFYATYFGMEKRVHEDDHLLILEGEDGSYLAFVEGDVSGENEPRRGTHFGFQAETVREVTELRARFASDGVVEAEWQERFPTRVQVFDPDGYRVELFAWK
jgi:catechol 2,3-dioxygenase-like lactoylglutathione lyase family enzyme